MNTINKAVQDYPLSGRQHASGLGLRVLPDMIRQFGLLMMIALGVMSGSFILLIESEASVDMRDLSFNPC